MKQTRATRFLTHSALLRGTSQETGFLRLKFRGIRFTPVLIDARIEVFYTVGDM